MTVPPEPALAAGVVATAILLPASWVIRGAPEALGSGRYSAFAGTMGFTALVVFAFLCARAVELLSLFGPGENLSEASDPAAREALLGTPFVAFSLAHGALAGLLTLLMAVLILRAASNGAQLKDSPLVPLAVRCTHAVVLLMVVLFVSFYLVR